MDLTNTSASKSKSAAPDLGQVLVQAKLLTAQQLQEARSAAGSSLAATLVEKGFVKEEALVSAAANTFFLPEASAADLEPAADVAGLVPQDLVKRSLCLPLRKEGDLLMMATADPTDESAVSAIARASGLSIKLLLAGPTAIAEATQRAYGGTGRTGAAKMEIPGPPVAELDEKLQHAAQELQADASEDAGDQLKKLELNDLDPPIVRFVNGLLLKALKMRASDIHIEALEKDIRTRFRIDGKLIDVLHLPKELKSNLISRIKIMGGMDIAERRAPQDGSIKMALTEQDSIDFRVSSLPNIYGEKIVLRVLGNAELRDSVDALGFEGQALEWVRESIANPFGMILVTGPTGTGKTTTLYTILSQLNDDVTNIVTAEDPVEYRLPGITQVNVKPLAGLTFDAALRSFLRQDPDIILVGEMRDYETAAIAVKAALTGHLVLSTIHTNDAPSTVVRLVDMGIEPYLVASAVKLVISQRLLRRICDSCKKDVDMEALEHSDLDEATRSSVEALYRGDGCGQCNGTGFQGRVPVYEVMPVKSKEMRRAITEGGTEVQVAQIAKREGVMSLAECAIDRVNQGDTTIEEASSVIAVE
ncbi:MAG: GspE/PulE family protein [Alphaproteobacteria bacterium]